MVMERCSLRTDGRENERVICCVPASRAVLSTTPANRKDSELDEVKSM